MSTASKATSQAIERIMRRAEDMGLDPRRVARALDLRPAPASERRAASAAEGAAPGRTTPRQETG